MKVFKAQIILAIPLVAVAVLATSYKQNALAGSTGSVKSQVAGATVGSHKAWLFRTGASQASQSISFEVTAYRQPVIQFNNVPTGYRYFIRVVDNQCDRGGQSSDGYLSSSTLSLPRCQVSSDWTSGCP